MLHKRKFTWLTVLEARKSKIKQLPLVIPCCYFMALVVNLEESTWPGGRPDKASNADLTFKQWNLVITELLLHDSHCLFIRVFMVIKMLPVIGMSPLNNTRAIRCCSLVCLFFKLPMVAVTEPVFDT